MNLSPIKFGLVLLVTGAVSSFAQQYSRFHEHPSERAELVEKLAKRAAEDKQNARAWAQARSKPIRFERNGTLYELAAVRNGKPLYYKTLNYRAAISTAADQVRSTSPYNLDGEGVTVGVWDGGEALTTHQEFGGRVTDKDNVDSHFHATHVGGTIGASGVQSNAKGMAPAVSIDSHDWFSDLSEMSSAAASAPGQAANLYLSNHSYGWGRGWEGGTFYGYEEFGQYNYYARQSDVIVANNQYYLPFFAAGNDRDDSGDGVYKSGFDCIADYAIAKNVMTVGAVNDAVSGSSRSLSGATMSGFSSWGPADDGRIKPDIVANGVGLYSCDNDHNSDYLTISGTSMATPNACGSAALLVEYYKELFSGGAMRASTLKGLIIHTADDLGRPGPDYQYGWGLMNTKAAADHLKMVADGALVKLTEANVTASQKTDTYTFQWDGVSPIRVTLCWTDPAGSSTSVNDNRTSVLKNDLDLKLAGPGGTYHPYKLSYANPSANATATGENNVDNVEQVYLAAPIAGTYTITVDYDGSLYQGSAQWYSLLVSGDSGDSDSDGMPDGWEVQYFGSPTNAQPEGDPDGDGSDNFTEYVAGTLPNNAASVFKVTSFTAPVSSEAPFILNWNTVAGRLYSVGYSDNLTFDDFTPFSNAIDLPYTQNSYTDTVERAGSQHFYRIDVRLQ
jgi:hypothetical protein